MKNDAKDTTRTTECPKGFRYTDGGPADTCMPSMRPEKFGRCIWCERKFRKVA